MVQNKSEVLYEKLRFDLMQGAVNPGDRISEAELSRQYGVSRSPIREAIVRLEADGLLVRSGMVIHVHERTDGEIIDIYRVRIELEASIAADAALRRDDFDLMNLRAAIDAEEKIDSADDAAVVTANRRIHDALASASHNATLTELQQRLTAQIAMLPATTLKVPGRWERAHREHSEIVKAVEARDAEAARASADRHMTEAKDLRLTLVAEQARSR